MYKLKHTEKSEDQLKINLRSIVTLERREI